jgi:hypothetical protein
MDPVLLKLKCFPLKGIEFRGRGKATLVSLPDELLTLIMLELELRDMLAVRAVGSIYYVGDRWHF